MSDLTKEELAELAALEEEEKERARAEASAAKRQHLEALRLQKKLAAKHGVPGRDFLVIETVVGNIAFRRPIDVEIDSLAEKTDDREEVEKFACAVAITPTADELRALMASHHGLAGAIVTHSTKMLRVVREEDAKK